MEYVYRQDAATRKFLLKFSQSPQPFAKTLSGDFLGNRGTNFS
jgi:hypothetical protein